MPFFNRTRLEHIGGRWAGDWAAARMIWMLQTWHGWFAISERGFPLQRQEKKKGPARASPVAAPMPKSVPF